MTTTQATIATLKNQPAHTFLLFPIIILMMAQFGITIDNISLAFATRDIINNLNADISFIALATSVYALITASFMIAAGLFAIVIRLRNALRIGVILAISGEIVLAFAPSIDIFIWVGRVLMGFSAAILIPSILGLVAAIYKGKSRAIAFGLIGTATGIAKIFSIAGGFIIDFLGFRIAFGILGVYFIILLLMTPFIPDVRSDNKKLRFDFVGTLILATGLFLFVIGVNKISAWGVITPLQAPFTLFGISPAIPLILSGILLLVILIPVENRIENKYGVALLPKSFYKNPTVRNGLYGCAMEFAALWAVVIAIYPFFILVANFSSGETGIAALPTSIAMILFSMLIPRLFPEINRQRAIRFAYVSFVIGFLIMAMGLEENSVNFLIYIGLGVIGIGTGLLASQANSAVANAVNKRDAEQSGGIQATARNVGETCSVTLLGLFLTFVQPTYFQHSVEKLPLTEQTQTFVSQQKFRFMSNEKFDELVTPLADNQQALLKQQYQKDRLTTSRLTMLAAALLSLLALFGTRHLPTGRKTPASGKSANSGAE